MRHYWKGYRWEKDMRRIFFAIQANLGRITGLELTKTTDFVFIAKYFPLVIDFSHKTFRGQCMAIETT